MTKIVNSIEVYEDLKGLNIKRLFNNQKLLLKELHYYCFEVYNKTRQDELLQDVLLINSIILSKLNKIEKNKSKHI